MKKILLILSFVFSGCYLANGSPSYFNYWIKDRREISQEDRRICGEKILPYLDKRYFFLVKRREELGFSEFYENKEEYREYRVYIDKYSKLLSQCYYDLGYRFQPPLYWCLAQDGDNTKICIENMKYRY